MRIQPDRIPQRQRFARLVQQVRQGDRLVGIGAAQPHEEKAPGQVDAKEQRIRRILPDRIRERCCAGAFLLAGQDQQHRRADELVADKILGDRKLEQGGSRRHAGPGPVAPVPARLQHGARREDKQGILEPLLVEGHGDRLEGKDRVDDKQGRRVGRSPPGVWPERRQAPPHSPGGQPAQGQGEDLPGKRGMAQQGGQQDVRPPG